MIIKILITLCLLISPVQYFDFLSKEPAPIFQPLLPFPEKAIITNKAKCVYVQILLDREGSVMRSRVAQSSGDTILDNAAALMTKDWKFTPAIQYGGRPVRFWVAVPVYFKPNRTVSLRESDISSVVSEKLKKITKEALERGERLSKKSLR